MYIFHFENSANATVSGLRWHHDPDVPNGEFFTLESSHVQVGGANREEDEV